MQLPDCCFGQKFVVSCDLNAPDGTSVWDISEVGLPDVCVIWEVNIFWYYAKLRGDFIRIALGDQLPTTVLMMEQLEPLINGYGRQGAGPRAIHGYVYVGQEQINMRKVVNAQGRRLVIQGTATVGGDMHVRVWTVVSSIPTEVPDWMVSEGVKSLL